MIMVDQSELQRNIIAIKCTDPYAKDIIDSAHHVCVYTFNSEEDKWEKTVVEAALFIYSRNAEPYYSVFINNRLNTISLVEPIAAQTRLKIKTTSLFLYNQLSRARCFQFHNKVDCNRIGPLVKRIIQSSDKISNYKNISKPQQANENIFSILTKAQEEFHKPRTCTVRNKAQNKSLTNSNVTSPSVMNFFAAAKPASPKKVTFYRKGLSQPVPVEQIEKQQWTVNQHQRNNPPQYPITIPKPFVSTGANSYTRSYSPSHPSEPSNSKFFNTQSMLPSRPSSNRLQLGLAQVGNNTTDIKEVELRKKSLQGQLKEIGEQFRTSGQPRPELMLPTMFFVNQNLKKEEKSLLQTSAVPEQSLLQTSAVPKPLLSNVSRMEQSEVPSKPEPLTQSQMLQAIGYLIKNDTNFLVKLHEAYLKSFNEMVSPN